MDNSDNHSPVTDENGRSYAEQQAAQKKRWVKPAQTSKAPSFPQPTHHDPKRWNSGNPQYQSSMPHSSWNNPADSPTGTPRYQAVFDNQQAQNFNGTFSNAEGEAAAKLSLTWGIIGSLLLFIGFPFISIILGVIGFRKAKQARSYGVRALGGYWLNLTLILFGAFMTISAIALFIMAFVSSSTTY